MAAGRPVLVCFSRSRLLSVGSVARCALVGLGSVSDQHPGPGLHGSANADVDDERRGACAAGRDTPASRHVDRDRIRIVTAQPGFETLRAQWTRSANMSAPISVVVRASDGRLLIRSGHAQLRPAGGIIGTQNRVIDGKPTSSTPIRSEAFEWAFPAIEGAAAGTHITGSTSGDVAGSFGPMQPAGSRTTAACSWDFARAGTTASAAPPAPATPPPPATATAPSAPAVPTTPPASPPATSTPAPPAATTTTPTPPPSSSAQPPPPSTGPTRRGMPRIPRTRHAADHTGHASAASRRDAYPDSTHRTAARRHSDRRIRTSQTIRPTKPVRSAS